MSKMEDLVSGESAWKEKHPNKKPEDLENLPTRNRTPSAAAPTVYAPKKANSRVPQASEQPT